MLQTGQHADTDDEPPLVHLKARDLIGGHPNKALTIVPSTDKENAIPMPSSTMQSSSVMQKKKAKGVLFIFIVYEIIY